MMRVGLLQFVLHTKFVSATEQKMAWERRPNGRQYYYRGRREGRRVVKEYAGGGEAGLLAAEADEASRRDREQAAQQRAERQRPLDDLVLHLDEFDKLVDQVVTGQLLSAGWTKHHRQWRPRNNGRIRSNHPDA